LVCFHCEEEVGPLLRELAEKRRWFWYEARRLDSI